MHVQIYKSIIMRLGPFNFRIYFVWPKNQFFFLLFVALLTYTFFAQANAN